MRRLHTGYLLSISAALAWSSTGPGIKYLLDHYQMPALAIAFWRDILIALACGLALLVVGRRGAWPQMTWRDLRGFALMGTISIGIYHALWVYSIALNGASLAVVLIYLYPAFVTLGAWLVFKEQITGTQLLALVLAFAGCVLLVRAYDPAVLRVSWIGVLVGVASAVTHAGYVLFSQRSVQRHSLWVSLAITMFFGAFTLLVLTILSQGARSITAVGSDPLPWLVLLGLALGPTLGGYGLFTLSLRHIPGRIASLVVMIEAPMATLLAVALLGERLAWIQVIGMALILVAAALPSLAVRLPRRRVPRVAQT